MFIISHKTNNIINPNYTREEINNFRGSQQFESVYNDMWILRQHVERVHCLFISLLSTKHNHAIQKNYLVPVPAADRSWLIQRVKFLSAKFYAFSFKYALNIQNTENKFHNSKKKKSNSFTQSNKYYLLSFK